MGFILVEVVKLLRNPLIVPPLLPKQSRELLFCLQSSLEETHSRSVKPFTDRWIPNDPQWLYVVCDQMG